jgi:hypothetical protein
MGKAWGRVRFGRQAQRCEWGGGRTSSGSNVRRRRSGGSDGDGGDAIEGEGSGAAELLRDSLIDALNAR